MLTCCPNTSKVDEEINSDEENDNDEESDEESDLSNDEIIELAEEEDESIEENVEEISEEDEADDKSQTQLPKVSSAICISEKPKSQSPVLANILAMTIEVSLYSLILKLLELNIYESSVVYLLFHVGNYIDSFFL